MQPLRHPAAVLFAASTALLTAGGILWLPGAHTAADALWIGGTAVGLAWSLVTTTAALVRRQATVDVIALLALAGALAVGEPFAGAVIAVMLGSGQLLEERAAARARRDLSQLVARAPRTARRRTGDTVVEVPVDEVRPGDRLVVGPGEIVPVDGRLLTPAVTDDSALTGEPLPVDRDPGDDLRSGVVNAGGPLELVTTTTAAESTYAGVVRLVEQAQASSAPFVRLADRLALYFVPLTLALAGAAWAVGGDPVRAVAVLVVATPCPLLLAAPIAIMSGLSRAARHGVVLKGGGALEQLAAGQVLLFDKTGTLTLGRPQVSAVAPMAGFPADELLRLAAALEQVSPHVLAGGVVAAARRRGLELPWPAEVAERPGAGVSGLVAGRRVRVGKAQWVFGDAAPADAAAVLRRAELDGALAVFVAADDVPAGALLLTDPLRPDAPRMVRALRAAGIRRVVLVTGDRAEPAAAVGRLVGVDTVLAGCDPAEKVEAVRRESAQAATIMVGDGINDAPALAAAGAGVALAARGTTASAEAADVVLTVDRIDALADAMLIARRSGRIAQRAGGVGMALSLVAMGVAAAGGLAPALGAVVQEVIDVIAIAAALVALTPGRLHTVALPPADVDAARRLRAEHDATLPVVDQVRAVADRLTTAAPDLGAARVLVRRLTTELLPHERTDEQVLVPLLARALGPDVTIALTRTHAEIENRVGRLQRLLDGLDDAEVRAEDVIELRRMLYGLHAILQLHNAQEEEGAFSLVPEDSAHRV